jgi:hypothetical protein
VSADRLPQVHGMHRVFGSFGFLGALVGLGRAVALGRRSGHWHQACSAPVSCCWLRYEAALWSMVFPLGMYAVAGIYLGHADNLPVVEAIGSSELWVALVVGTTVFAAMAYHVVNTVFRLPEGREPVPD